MHVVLVALRYYLGNILLWHPKDVLIKIVIGGRDEWANMGKKRTNKRKENSDQINMFMQCRPKL